MALAGDWTDWIYLTKLWEPTENKVHRSTLMNLCINSCLGFHDFLKNKTSQLVINQVSVTRP